MKIVALVGSLRKDSYNRSLARAAAELVPAGSTIELIELHDIPFYDGDVEEAGFPPSVVALGKTVKAAGGVLVASPEYNYSIPGVLKNALDWLSRLPDKPMNDKPTAIVSASMGIFGGARMQYQLRQSFLAPGLSARVLARPEFFLAEAHKKIGADGKLADEETRKRLGALVTALTKL